MTTIAPVRSSPIAGAWYEGNPKALARIVDQYLDQAELPELPGEVIAVIAPHAGQEFMALNGGPEFTFLSAISFFVNCETQEEVDGLWEKLSEAEKNKNAAGLKTSVACHGRSFPRL